MARAPKVDAVGVALPMDAIVAAFASMFQSKAEAKRNPPETLIAALEAAGFKGVVPVETADTLIGRLVAAAQKAEKSISKPVQAELKLVLVKGAAAWRAFAAKAKTLTNREANPLVTQNAASVRGAMAVAALEGKNVEIAPKAKSGRDAAADLWIAGRFEEAWDLTVVENGAKIQALTFATEKDQDAARALIGKLKALKPIRTERPAKAA